MFFGIDIDQTISTGYHGQTLEESIAYYRAAGLIIPEIVASKHDLFQLPDVMKRHEVLLGALEGVTLLAQHGTIHYFTVRKHEDTATNADIQQITHSWLEAKGFPFPYHTIFCRSSMHKLVMLYEVQRYTDDPLFLIDDRWWKVLEAFQQIAANPQYSHITDALRPRLTLVAFGAGSLPNVPEIPVLALPSWLHVADLLADCCQARR